MEYSTLTNEDVKKIILDSGVIDAAKLKEIEQFSQERNVSFADFCISRGIIPAEELTKLVADALKIPFIYLSGRTPEAEVFSIVPEVVARKKKIVSFKKNKKGNTPVNIRDN